MSTNIKPHTNRRAAKGFRRRQLIEATIESIAKRGLGDTTLAHVSQKAGLSQGIINLHFVNKENLLTETLRYVRDEYEQAWQNALTKSSSDPASQLANLLRADYQAAVADPKKLAVWFAFWGEVKSRPTYRKICQDRVTDYTKVLEEILTRLIADGDYAGVNVPELSESIKAMADGLWLNMLISAKGFRRRDAEKVMMQFMAQTFPKHADAFLPSRDP